jgi:DNA (cytosine-5)-methyltransferase 1
MWMGFSGLNRSAPHDPLLSYSCFISGGRVNVLRALDLFCCAGGATRGLQNAGFHVTGVDIRKQPRYCGDAFYEADALSFPLDGFDFIWASPPCQRYSDLAKRNGTADQWPDLIEPTRQRLEASGTLYVIENVEGAPLNDPVTLCGTMFPGLRVLRHRGFEANFPLSSPPHGKHPLVFTHDKRKSHYGKLDQDASFVQVTGGGNCSTANAAAAMGIDWMTKGELNEAIPPAYSEFIGLAAIQDINLARAA